MIDHEYRADCLRKIVNQLMIEKRTLYTVIRNLARGPGQGRPDPQVELFDDLDDPLTEGETHFADKYFGLNTEDVRK